MADSTSVNTITAEPEFEGEPVTLAEVKQHLRIAHDQLDAHIRQLVVEARDYFERTFGRTLRTTVTRTRIRSDWPTGRWYFDYPPLLSFDSIAYYDADNSSQSFSTDNVVVVTSTNGASFMEWIANVSLPDLYDRPDAVTVTYKTGWTTQSAIPATAKHAIKLWVESNFIETDPAKIPAAR